MELDKRYIWAILLGFGAFFSACQNQEEPLPYIGRMEIVNGDTLYHKIPDFAFLNQDSQLITPQTFDDKIYVSDFFFTSCPSICPKVKKQMLRIYEQYQNEDRFLMVSHSIDPVRDTVEHLRAYAENLGVSSDTWHFLTGESAKIFDMADAYFVSAMVDADAPGGFDHSGRIILVDQNKHVRSYCDGTNPEEVTEFLRDIQQLLDESSK